MRAFLSPSFLVVKAIFLYDGYKSFWPCPEESVWGFLAPTQITLYCKAAECIWHPAFRFSKISLCTSVLWFHVCVFWLTLLLFTCIYTYTWSFISVCSDFFFIFIFFGSSRIYCSNCANCNGLFRSYMSRKTTITYSLYM